MAAPAFDREDILRTYQLFSQPGDVIELRIPKAGRYGTISGYFNEARALADSVVALADENFAGVYFTINPCNPDLLARSANRYQKYAKETTADADIIRRRWLPIDLDPIRPSGISSNEDEHQAALHKARDIREWLISKGWPASAFILADSGNGGHLAVRIDLLNDEAARDLVKTCLESLDTTFTDEAVKVDTTTYNAARIWKVYGTMARKGSSTTDRPHRLSTIIEAPAGETETVSREQLEALAAIRPTKEQPTTTKSSQGATAFDPVRYAEDHGAKVLRTKAWNGGTLATLAVCPFNPEHDRGEAFLGVQASGARYFACKHESCKGNDWQALKRLWSPTSPEPAEKASIAEITRDSTTIRLDEVADLTYKKDGELKKARFSPTFAARAVLEKMPLAMSEESEEIHRFDGQIYRPDGARIIDCKLCEAAGDLFTDFQRRETLRRVSNQLLNHPVKFDPNPYLLGVKNGVADLLTGEVRDYRPEDLITDQIPVSYDPTARCPAFLAFLESITPNVSDRITLIDWLVATAIKEPLPYVLFLLGLGRNGKGLYERVMKEFFSKSAFRDMPLAEIGKSNFAAGGFYKKRGWIASETGKVGKTKSIGTDFIKLTSGNGVIDSDRKNKSRIQFEPYFQTVVDTNTMPQIDDKSKGWMERFVKVDLPYIFLANPDPNNPLEKLGDPGLFDKLTTEAELSGILNLLLFRSQAIGKSGRIHKRSGSEMFTEYGEQSSSVATFLENFCEYIEDGIYFETPFEPIYEAYREWCGYKVGEVVDIRYFGKQLKNFCGGVEPRRGKTKDRKNIKLYRRLNFDSSKCREAIEALRLSISPNVSIMSPSNLYEEEDKQSLQIALYPLSPLSLWNKILRQFGDQTNVQTCTSIKKISPIGRIPQFNGENGDNGDNDIKRPCEMEEQRRQDGDIGGNNGDKPSKISSYQGPYETVLILQDVPLFRGVNGLNYRLHRQGVATIPAVHARNLIRTGHAVEIHANIGPHPRRDAPTPIKDGAEVA